MTPTEYDDDLSLIEARENLWRTVLTIAVNDAISGEGILGSPAVRIREIEAARRYVTIFNCDFNEVCSLAGLEPDAVRERVTRQLETAPSPEEIVSSRRPARRAGVVSNFMPSMGTGAGSTAQEIPEITFSEQEASQ